MSWVIFDERGTRVPRQQEVTDDGHLRPVFGYEDEHYFRPSTFATRMAKGWRVFGLDVGEFTFITHTMLCEWWQSVSPSDKRLPSIAAVEMYVRHTT